MSPCATYICFQAAGPKKKAAEHITEDKWLAKVQYLTSLIETKDDLNMFSLSTVQRSLIPFMFVGCKACREGDRPERGDRKGEAYSTNEAGRGREGKAGEGEEEKAEPE